MAMYLSCRKKKTDRARQYHKVYFQGISRRYDIHDEPHFQPYSLFYRAIAAHRGAMENGPWAGTKVFAD